MLSQIKIPTKNGRKIPAIYCDHGANLTLLVHGITSEKTEDGFFTELANQLIDRSQSVLSMDLPGHGDSAITFTEMRISQMVEDLAITYAFAKKKHQNINFVCNSFGASIFLLCTFASMPHPNKVVLLNPVTDYRTNFVCADTEWGRQFSPQIKNLNFWEVEKHKVPGRNLYLGRGFISDLALLSPQSVHLGDEYETLVIHGEQDTVISIQSAFNFTKNRTPNSTKFISIPNARHGFQGYEKAIFENILTFFNL